MNNNRPKILYAIQGTGNGHVARAREIIPILQKYGYLDVVLSGDQSEVQLPVEPKYRSKGLTFIYNSKGGISYWKTLIKNNIISIINEVRRFPVDGYDLVINDFEFISAWACKLRKKKCYGLGHQASFLSKKTPRPARKEWLGEVILKNYAPTTNPVGFHFDEFDEFIFKPVIRSQIRNAEVINEGHYTVYLPAFSDENIHEFLSAIPEKNWQVFSKRTDKKYIRDNVSFYPIDNETFISSFISCEGLFTSAGFETPAEAIFMGKKLLVIPIRFQYEQFCNAAAMQEIGIPAINNLDQRGLEKVREWVRSGRPVNILYPDQTEEIILNRIIVPHFAGHPEFEVVRK